MLAVSYELVVVVAAGTVVAALAIIATTAEAYVDTINGI